MRARTTAVDPKDLWRVLARDGKTLHAAVSAYQKQFVTAPNSEAIALVKEEHKRYRKI